MRSETVIKQQLLDFAQDDARVRAVLLNGSRANPNVTPDAFQDFDVVFIVTVLEGFLTDPHWVDIFGERVMMQLPDTMTYVGVEADYSPISFGYLMQFKDGHRIDLTLFPLDKVATEFEVDSLTVVWLDKDGLFKDVPASSDRDYHIRRPDQQEFSETCNEFWWVIMNVSKGLRRHQLSYAKEMLEKYTRPMLMQLLSWKIGAEHHFSVSFGNGGKWMERYLPETLYHKILKTYTGYELHDNWVGLLDMAAIFRDVSQEVAGYLQLEINLEDACHVTAYLEQQFDAFRSGATGC